MDTPNNDFEQFKHAFHLTDDELEAMDNAVMAYVEANPMPETDTVHAMKPSTKKVLSVAGLFGKRLAYGALAIAVLFTAGAGTVLASNDALPGDRLYGVKLNVSEELRSMFIFNEVREAQWETERLQRRLSELQQLILRDGGIDPTVLEQTQARMASYGEDIADATERFEEQGNTDAIADVINDLQRSMNTYTDILSSLVASSDGEVYEGVDELLTSIEKTERAAQAARLDLVIDEVGEVDNAVERTDEDPYFSILFPSSGDVLYQGDVATIRWEHDVENAKYVQLDLLDTNRNEVGFITSVNLAQSGNVATWNPTHTHAVLADGLQLAAIPPGDYVIQMTVITQGLGQRSYKTTSQPFEIKPKVQLSNLGTLAVTVLDEDQRPIQDVAVVAEQVDDDSIAQRKITDAVGVTYFTLDAGDYIISSYRNNSLVEQERIAVAGEWKRTYLTLTIGTDGDDTEQIDLRPEADVSIIQTPLRAKPRAVAGDHPTVATARLQPITTDVELKRVSFRCQVDEPLNSEYMPQRATLRYGLNVLGSSFIDYELDVVSGGTFMDIYFEDLDFVAETHAWPYLYLDIVTSETNEDLVVSCTLGSKDEMIIEHARTGRVIPLDRIEHDTGPADITTIYGIDIAETRSLPDLVVEEPQVTWIALGDDAYEIHLSYTIANRGTADWEHEVFPVMRVLQDGDEIFFDNNRLETNSCYGGETLAVGDSCDISTTYTMFLTGEFDVELWAANKRPDPTELDRDNNGWYGSFTIRR